MNVIQWHTSLSKLGVRLTQGSNQSWTSSPLPFMREPQSSLALQRMSMTTSRFVNSSRKSKNEYDQYTIMSFIPSCCFVSFIIKQFFKDTLYIKISNGAAVLCLPTMAQ